MNFVTVLLVFGFIGGSVASFKLEAKRDGKNQKK
jgi:hypothetical protein